MLKKKQRIDRRTYVHCFVMYSCGVPCCILLALSLCSFIVFPCWWILLAASKHKYVRLPRFTYVRTYVAGSSDNVAQNMHVNVYVRMSRKICMSMYVWQCLCVHDMSCVMYSKPLLFTTLHHFAVLFVSIAVLHHGGHMPCMQ